MRRCVSVRLIQKASDERAIGLPGPFSRLIGREETIAALRSELFADETRLVTLLGPGGSGKTRIAIALGTELIEHDGLTVAFLDLTAIQAASGIVPALARLFDLPETEASIFQALAGALADRVDVLILDNLEQIPDASGPVNELLSACPPLLILATSRIPLRLSAELRWQVEPLVLPRTDDMPVVQASSAVDLFVKRASQVRLGFTLTPENAASIAAICRRLDGLPLAIELAAARVGILSPSALLARLERRLVILTGGMTDAPDRQRTMRDAIAWSYELLDAAAQSLFRRLSIVPAGFSLAAAESIGGGDALEQLQRLVEQSLVVSLGEQAGEPRFRMLETIREYGQERLEDAGEREDAETRLSDWVEDFALATTPETWGSIPPTIADRVNVELPTIGAALRILHSRGHRAAYLRIVNAVNYPLSNRGRYLTLVEWLEVELGVDPSPKDQLEAEAVCMYGKELLRLGRQERAMQLTERAVDYFRQCEAGEKLGVALYFLGLITYGMGRLEESRTHLREALSIADRLDNKKARLHTENVLAFIYADAEEYEEALEIFARHVEQLRRSDDGDSLSIAMGNMAMTLIALGKDDEALHVFEEASGLAEAAGSRDSLSQFLSERGALAVKLGHVDDGSAWLERGLSIAREDRNRWAECVALLHAGMAAAWRCEYSRAMAAHQDSLEIAVEIGVLQGVQAALTQVAHVCFRVQRDQEAAELLGAADQVRERIGLPPRRREPFIAELRTRLGQRRFGAAYDVGRALSSDEAIARALLLRADGEETPESTRRAHEQSASGTDGFELTPREVDVLRQLAAGKTNVQIGEALYISPFTAKTHVANLLGKLGLENRAAAASWASANGLV